MKRKITNKFTKKRIGSIIVLILMIISVPVPMLFGMMNEILTLPSAEEMLADGEFHESNELYEDGQVFEGGSLEAEEYRDVAMQSFVYARDLEIQQMITEFDAKPETLVDYNPDQMWYDSVLAQDEVTPPLGEIEGFEPVIEVLGKKSYSVMTKTTYSQGLVVVRTRSISGFSEVEYTESNIDIPDISIPVVDPKERVSTGVYTQTDIVTMGYKETKPIIDDTWTLYWLSKSIIYPVRYSIDMTYEFTYQFELPIEVTITHPDSAIPGESYEFEINVKSRTGEMGIDLDCESDIEGEEYYWYIRWIKKYKKVWRWRIPYWVPKFYGRWRYYSVPSWVHWIQPPELSIAGEVETPLNDEPGYVEVTDPLGIDHIDLEDLWSSGSFMDRFFPIREFGFAPTVGVLFGDKVTAQMGAAGEASYTTLENSTNDHSWRVGPRTFAWGNSHSTTTTFSNALETFLRSINRAYAYNLNFFSSMIDMLYDEGIEFPDSGETKSLTFTVPQTASGNVQLSANNFRYYPRYFVLTPAIYIKWGGILPESTWTINIPVIGSGIGASIMEFAFKRAGTYLPSDYSYSTEQTYSFADSYEFGFARNERYNPYPTTIKFTDYRANSQIGSFYVKSLGNAEDVIHLDVLGLPNGYSYKFVNKEYSYSYYGGFRYNYVDRLSSDYELTYNYASRLITSDPVYVMVISPDRIDIPPGEVDITIVGTSRAQTVLGETDPTENMTMKLPIIAQYGFEFNPQGSIGDVIQVNPGETVNINFEGSNLANGNDIINVRGIYHGVNNITSEWIRNYAVGRYTLPNQTFSGGISFTYSPYDIFPEAAGNYTFELIATSQGDSTKTNSTYYVLQFMPYYNVTTTMDPEYTIMYGNYMLEFNLTVTNIGNAIDNYTIQAEGWKEYLNFTTRVENLQAGSSTVVLINLTVPNPFIVPIQNHTFRISAISDGNSQIYDESFAMVNYLNPDPTPPGLARWYENGSLNYPNSSLNLGPYWNPGDANPTNYEIYVNDSLYDSGTWSDNEKIGIFIKNVPGYGEYTTFNVTAVFYDAMNNNISDTVWVNIHGTDDIAPELNPQTDPFYDPNQEPKEEVEFYDQYFKGMLTAPSTSDSIDLPLNWAYPVMLNWECDEEWPMEMNLYLNDVLLPESSFTLTCTESVGQYEWNTTYILNPGDLGLGTSNFTFEIKDMSGYNVSSMILVNVLSSDSTDPLLLTAPATSVVEDGTVSFTTSDTYPHHWNLLIDGKVEATDYWTDSVSNDILVEEIPLILGSNSVELRIYDIADNYYTYTWGLTFRDVTAPQILVAPDDTTVFEHNNTDFLYWEVIDNYPNEFTISIDGEEVDSGIWTVMNNTFRPGMESLPMGSYEFEAVFSDMSGNEVSSSFTLTVEDVIEPTIIEMRTIVYEPALAANWFEFHIIDTHPESYQLYRNDTLVAEGDVFEHFKIVNVDLEDLTIGTYNYRIELTDESGNTGSGSVDVVVMDISSPVIDADGSVIISEGETIPLTWTIKDTSTKTYSLYRNGTLADSETFDSEPGNITVTYNPMALALGLYEFVLTVEDAIGLSHSFIMYVSVVDLAAPKISKMGSIKVDFGDPNAYLSWSIVEAHPDTYQILVDGTTLEQGSWDGTSISLSLDSWAKGTFEVTLIVTDESGNMATDVVEVIITESESETQLVSSPFAPPIVILFSLCFLIVLTRSSKKRDKE